MVFQGNCGTPNLILKDDPVVQLGTRNERWDGEVVSSCDR